MELNTSPNFTPKDLLLLDPIDGRTTDGKLSVERDFSGVDSSLFGKNTHASEKPQGAKAIAKRLSTTENTKTARQAECLFANTKALLQPVPKNRTSRRSTLPPPKVEKAPEWTTLGRGAKMNRRSSLPELLARDDGVSLRRKVVEEKPVVEEQQKPIIVVEADKPTRESVAKGEENSMISEEGEEGGGGVELELEVGEVSVPEGLTESEDERTAEPEVEESVQENFEEKNRSVSSLAEEAPTELTEEGGGEESSVVDEYGPDGEEEDDLAPFKEEEFTLKTETPEKKEHIAPSSRKHSFLQDRDGIVEREIVTPVLVPSARNTVQTDPDGAKWVLNSDIFVGFTIPNLKTEPTESDYEKLANTTQRFYEAHLTKRYSTTFQSISVSKKHAIFQPNGVPRKPGMPKGETYQVYIEWDMITQFADSSKAPNCHQVTQSLVDKANLNKFLCKDLPALRKTPFRRAEGVFTHQTTTITKVE